MTQHTEDSARRLVIDRERGDYLDDVGAPGCSVAMVLVVDPTGQFDGIEVPVLLRPDATMIRDMLCSAATHEQLGPLSVEWRQRVRDATWRCGRTTKNGTRCRTQVGHRGDACRWHRGPEQLAFKDDR
ncbi:hypothetical protein BA059_03280 [Mycolicibacterium sp. (ex Dasyatis americana)]|uniref:Uncharacterized protein n=1 Tax=Mycolicibacterium fortuitum TaxID=1766 RepID=A0A0N9XD06_MYCFO|nr:hypothetical protein [Mycolicibacterium fortuitum]ALI26564.1 hypothetical protein XA26_27240 [Mycolicibacterium fortuitum]OFB43696.1 hypothetical protein BA059_03280 [Mycolicibacterium sp. (ex Dasyatis americana)]